jgi:hypothetical protein
MQSQTVLINATTNPTTIRIRNSTLAAIILNNGSATVGGGPCAYVTIVKLTP